MRRMIFVHLCLMAVLLLSACASATEPVAVSVEDPAVEADVVEDAVVEEPMQEPVAADPEGCLGSADAAVVDLNCQEVTIAVENAYLPFNYISLETGEIGRAHV